MVVIPVHITRKQLALSNTECTVMRHHYAACNITQFVGTRATAQCHHWWLALARPFLAELMLLAQVDPLSGAPTKSTTSMRVPQYRDCSGIDYNVQTDNRLFRFFSSFVPSPSHFIAAERAVGMKEEAGSPCQQRNSDGKHSNRQYQ